MLKSKVVILISLFFCFVTTLRSQYDAHRESGSSQREIQETGLPYIQNYTPKEYQGNARNFGTVQDSLGILYFANGNGVLMYDGVDWELIELPKKTWALSIAIDENNRVYVGGSGEFGYLEPDALGKMNYVSLSALLDKSQPEFTWIWGIHVTKEGVYFREKEFLFRWADSQFKVWRGDNIFDTSFLVESDLYINVRGEGLKRMEKEELKLVPNGSFFGDKRISALLRYGDNGLLIGALESFYVYQNEEVIPFSTELDEFVKKYKLYSGIKLDDHSFALASANGGMAVMDESGNKLVLIDREKTLASLAMNGLFQDRSGIIWATLEYGISKIEYPSPFSTYGQQGINSTCFALDRFQNELFAGTENGLFRMVHHSGEASFENVAGIKDAVSDIQPFGNSLLIATDNGLFELSDDLLSRIGEWYPTRLLRSSIDPNRVFVSLGDGIGSIYYNEGTWEIEGLIEGVRGTIGIAIEQTSGNLWLGSTDNSIWQIAFENIIKAKNLEDPRSFKFGLEHGLPDERGNLYKVDETIFVRSRIAKETFRFDEDTKVFRQDDTFAAIVGRPGMSSYLYHVDRNGNLIFITNNSEEREKHILAWKTDSGAYAIRELNEERGAEDMGTAILIEAKDSVIWHGGTNGVLRYDIKLDKSSKEVPRALLKKVIYDQDSLLVAGTYSTSKFELPFKNSNLRFKFASPYFYLEEANSYQYKLEGSDESWSSWIYETQKDYTNIREGDYDFRVRARNIYGNIGDEASYRFTILPPWYRSWWAYLAYALMGALLIWTFSHWRSVQLRKKNLILEAVVAERTEEVRKKNKMLSYQTERLKELDTMKTRLFANISHEFRTPLTLIKGPVEKLEREQKTQISMPNIKMIRRNANRLLNLVNQLLDLSKLDSGKLKLNEAEGDLFKSIRAAASSFSSHAASRNMDYRISVPSTMLWTSFDRDKLEKILYNLLSNAFKFTEDEGRVLVKAEFRNHKLRLKVADTGAGIHLDKLPHIFDRFYQVDDSYTREKAGSGIGLALTKELVELMGGTLFAESEPGRGTEFRVVIPLEKIETVQAPVSDYEVEVLPEEAVEMTIQKTDKQKAIGPVILIIEDNNDMRFFIREQLEGEYDILEAIHGEDGLDKASTRMPDLIISDLMMPRMDGITLCRQLKTQRTTSHIPIIMLTAKAGIENKLEGLETGADEYLTKPFNAQELQVRVRNLITQRQQLRELYSRNISLDPKQITVTSVDEEFLEEVLTLMEEKYTDASFGPSQLQKALAMSKTQLHRKLKALTNHPPSELLRNFRLKRAAQVLPQRKDNISQVAYDVGFNSLSYFTKCFKDLYGISPTQYVEGQMPDTK